MNIAAEGVVDVTAATRLCEHTGHRVDRTYPRQGKSKLDRQMESFNNAARFSPWLVLRDLDQDAECAPSLKLLLPKPSQFMLVRIAVRAVESWLLADRVSFATFFRVPEHLIPAEPDGLPNPKQTVLDLVAKSKSRNTRTAMLPNDAAWRTVGRGYPGQLMEYIRTSWKIDAATGASPSLRRCVAALMALENGDVG